MANTRLLNINSSLFVESSLEIESNKISDLETEIRGITNNIWPRPIFMVDKELMDIICPPELKRYYDPEKIKENIDRHTKGERRSNTLDKRDGFPWREILGEGIEVPAEGDISLYFQNFWGVYLHTISPINFDEILKALEKQKSNNKSYYENIIRVIEDLKGNKISEPFIFICPERIKPFAQKLGTSGASVLGHMKDFKLVLKYVIYKCVCYHYFNPNINISGTWTRLVNNSLATFFSLRSLEEQESKVATLFLNRGSVEDRTYECWEKLTPSKITREINIWLVKWSLGEPAISTSHDSQIYSKLHKNAHKTSLQPTLNSDKYSFEFIEQYNNYIASNNGILNDGVEFWEQIAWNLLLAWRNIS